MLGSPETRVVRLHRETLEVQIVRWLRDEILTGRLGGGTPLVQSELARQFGTSRIPIRDALRRLEADGLVLGDARGICTVESINAQDVEELYEIRRRLEALATGLAARKMSLAEHRGLEDLFARMDEVVRRGDVEPYSELDYQFHLTIYEGSRNRRLVRSIAGISSGIPPLAPISIEGRLKEAHREHRAILHALRKRDPDAAESAAEHHVAQALAGLLATFRARPDAAPDAAPDAEKTTAGGRTNDPVPGFLHGHDHAVPLERERRR